MRTPGTRKESPESTNIIACDILKGNCSSILVHLSITLAQSFLVTKIPKKLRHNEKFIQRSKVSRDSPHGNKGLCSVNCPDNETNHWLVLSYGEHVQVSAEILVLEQYASPIAHIFCKCLLEPQLSWRKVG